MDINVEFGGVRRTHGAISARPKVAAVNLTGEAMRKHERIMEYRNLANQLNANFQSAMASLASANADIDRLNAENAKLKSEVERMQGELRNEREKSARFVGKKNQNQKFQRPNG